MAVEAQVTRSISRKVRALKWSRRLRRPPLLAHLVGFALTILIPSLIVGVFLILQFSRQQESFAAAQVDDTAKIISNSVDRDIYGMITAGRVLASSPSVYGGDLEIFRSRTGAALTGTDMTAVLIDREERALVSTLRPNDPPAETVVPKDAVRQVFETRQAKVSDVYRDPLGTLRFAIVVPILKANAVEYVLAISKRADRLGEIIADRDLPRAWSTKITDRTGNHVFAAISAGGRLAPQEEGGDPGKLPALTSLLPGANAQEMVEASTTSVLTGWRTTVAVPSSIIGQPIVRSWLFLLGASAVQVIFSVVLGVYFGKRIAVPMMGLARQAEAIGRGEPTTTINTDVEEIGNVSRVLALASRARIEAEEQNRFLMREMTHRAKNQYALIGAIARRAAKDSADTGQFLATLSEALASLARSADLLAAQGWDSVPLGELVSSQLKAFGSGGPQIVASGPLVQLNPTAAQTIGLALHELATNAAKYGALSCEAGTVRIEWSLDADLTLVWQEAGGPVVAEPKRSGFGTLVTQKMTARGLGGSVDMDFHPAGVRWCLTAPSTTILAH